MSLCPVLESNTNNRFNDAEVKEPNVRALSHHHVAVSLLCFLLFSSTLFHDELPGRIGLRYSWNKTKVKAATFAMAQLIEQVDEYHHSTELPTLYQTDRDRLETLHDIRYNNTNYTWAHNFDILKQTGHQWCSILRDNHACFGDKYAAILNITTPFQGRRYNLLSFQARHERILAVGNSHLLELFYLPICATPSSSTQDVFAYHFGQNTFLFHAELFAPVMRQTTMLILDNDNYFASASAIPERTANFLDEISFLPTIIILGIINGGVVSCKERQQTYAEHFPQARIICRCGTLRSSEVETGLADSCAADGNDCESAVSGHQCVPSRGVIRGSEDLWSELIEERAFRSQCPPT